MESIDLSVIWLIVAAILILVVLRFFWRGNRASYSTAQRAVHGLLIDIKINMELVEYLIDGEQIKRFSVTGWKMHKSHIGFLGHNLQTAISEAYSIAEDYNWQVAGTSTFQESDYVADIDIGRMKDCLRRSKSGLEDWLMKNVGTLDPGGNSNFFSNLLGGW